MPGLTRRVVLEGDRPFRGLGVVDILGRSVNKNEMTAGLFGMFPV